MKASTVLRRRVKRFASHQPHPEEAFLEEVRALCSLNASNSISYDRKNVERPQLQRTRSTVANMGISNIEITK
jgi:hypothetical protein